MAKIPMNALTRHLKGRIGDVVFRIRDGEPYAALRPRRVEVTQTAALDEAQRRFKKATQYAKASLQDPALLLLYTNAGKANKSNAFSAAVGDWFKPPFIEEIDLRNYAGAIADTIVVTAGDDVGVTAVKVAIRDLATLALVEEGPAAFTNGFWVYAATAALAPNQGVTITATATDHPGNEGTATKPYP